MRGWDKKDFKKKLNQLKPLIQEAKEKELNEAETRRRLEPILTDLLGYNAFSDLSGELMIRGTGTDHLDYAIKLDNQLRIVIEVKPACVTLGEKHLRQVISYGMNAGVEWCLLTNSVDWQLYHIEFIKPVRLTPVLTFNVLCDCVDDLYVKMAHLTKRSILKNSLEKLWQKTEGLHPTQLFKATFNSTTINSIRKNIRRETGILVSPEEVISAFRKMLNENALKILNDMNFSYLEKKPRKTKIKKEETGNQNVSPGPNPGEANT